MQDNTLSVNLGAKGKPVYRVVSLKTEFYKTGAKTVLCYSFLPIKISFYNISLTDDQHVRAR